jgi:hypothetical protein
MSLAPSTLTRTFHCGPVTIELDADPQWIDRLQPELLMFDVPFDGPKIAVHFAISPSQSPPPNVRGTYLQCQRFKADRDGANFILRSQADAHAFFDTAARTLSVSAPTFSEALVEEVEQFLIFAFVWGWRQAGYTPLHCATLIRNGGCALICAESCGGKSTFTAACVRRGFQTLGDDKILLRPTQPVSAHALSQSMNLDPAVARWFPETAPIAQLKPYSRWTPKRKARIESLWPGTTRAHAVPTMLLRLSRKEHPDPISLHPLESAEIMQALARQTVIPTDRKAAAAILPTIMQLAGQLRGYALHISPNAYDHPNCLAPVEALFA